MLCDQTVKDREYRVEVVRLPYEADGIREDLAKKLSADIEQARNSGLRMLVVMDFDCTVRSKCLSLLLAPIDPNFGNQVTSTHFYKTLYWPGQKHSLAFMVHTCSQLSQYSDTTNH